jgi:hypothetical protein
LISLSVFASRDGCSYLCIVFACHDDSLLNTSDSGLSVVDCGVHLRVHHLAHRNSHQAHSLHCAHDDHGQMVRLQVDFIVIYLFACFFF